MTESVAVDENNTSELVEETIPVAMTEEVGDAVQGSVGDDGASEPSDKGNTVKRQFSIADLVPKTELEGNVIAVELYGAFVDVGVERPAMLHISQFSEEPVYDLHNRIKVGDAVKAWVMDVDKERQRVTLTLIKPPAVTWGELNINDVVTGTVVRIEKYGAFVDVGGERPGLIHVSELGEDYVSSPNTVVNVGDVVRAKIIGLDKKKRQIDLSIRALEAENKVMPEEERDEELTAMAMALRQALGSSGKDDRRRKKGKDSKRHRPEQDDIISRTLQYHKDK